MALFDALLGDGAVTVTDSGTVSIQAPSSSSTSLANPFTEYDTLAPVSYTHLYFMEIRSIEKGEDDASLDISAY